jgi:hypothetical protein
MNLTELVEQLELIQQDHPHSARLDVRVSDLDIFGVHLSTMMSRNLAKSNAFVLLHSNPNRETAEVFTHLGFSFSSPSS